MFPRLSPIPPPPLLKGKITWSHTTTSTSASATPAHTSIKYMECYRVMGHNFPRVRFLQNLGSRKPKAYHWSKLKKGYGTIWADAQNPGEALKSSSGGHLIVLGKFIPSAETEVKSLGSLFNSVAKNIDDLYRYFGEDPRCLPYDCGNYYYYTKTTGEKGSHK
ncbi:hypothetical protein Tco_0892561 [Tanacetum coccineum]|uniref:Uncharacterized protein n=1 Tax=Tanacetum coccineum TaxID=301880 RepID=A0ABQ5C7T9_9ASTR